MTSRFKRLAIATCLVAVLATVATPALGAGPEYMNFWTQPFSEVDETCSGELVEISGTLRHHVVFVVDGGGGFHGNGIFVGSATGVTESGTTYIASFTDQLSQYSAPGDGTSVGSAPFSFRLVSADGSPNLYVTGSFHITVNADGEIVASWTEFDVVCR